MTENSLIVVESGGFLAPVTTVEAAKHRYQDMKDFVSSILAKGVDYGEIPGTSKPTLLKPGAEKLATFFGLSVAFQLEDKTEDWNGKEHDGEPFFYYRYKCQSRRNGVLVAECEGSANSFEKKYRYRNASLRCPACGNETIIKGNAEYGGGWVCFKKKGGCGAKFADNDVRIAEQPRGQVKNQDVADLVNTIQKIAQKRAYVGMVLLAVNGSEYFTQDIEDFDFVEGVIVEQQPAQKPAPKPIEYPEWVFEVANSKGVKYTALDTDTLLRMYRQIEKSEPSDENETKKRAIEAIMAARNEK